MNFLYRLTRSDEVTDIIEKGKKEFLKKWNDPPKSRAEISDFEHIRTLGTGSFGRVMLVRHKKNNDYFAMKILDKEKIFKMKQIEHTMNEKKILQCMNWPFVVGLACHGKDNTNLYMILEFVSGGEMFTHLRKSGRFSEELTRFYAAQVIMSFQYLHANDLVYRDLKPENILIDNKGYLKITDFGFCKRVEGRTYTLCGTPEYIAPEILQNKPYGKSVDWWAVGVLIYEMAAGFPPFSGDTHMKIYTKIIAGKYRFPGSFCSELRDLITNLLQNDITKRFGNLKNGIYDLRDHKFFTPINWTAVYHKKIIPSFVPKVKGPGDDSNFDKYDEEPLKHASKEMYAKEFADF